MCQPCQTMEHSHKNNCSLLTFFFLRVLLIATFGEVFLEKLKEIPVLTILRAL